MFKMKLIVVFLIFSYVGLTLQADWSYDYETQWPGSCRVGTKQSPINIMTRNALVDQHEAHIIGPLVFRGYQQVLTGAVNNGHTLKWNNVPGSGSAPVLSGGPLRGNYTFLQFHLHWLSEHALDGIKYPLEIHFVHIKTGLTVPEALQRPDGLSVVGVLCQVQSGPESEYALEEIMATVPSLLERTDNETEASIIDLTRLISPEPQSYYTYHGSLTTPQCDEVVTWIVMDKPLTISDTQYKLFSKVNIGRIGNYRSLQPSNRVVYRSMPSCSSMLAPGSIGFYISALGCLTTNLASAFKKGICAVVGMKKRLFGDYLSECRNAVN